jgi:flavin-dependent dehydrogenase
LTGAAWDVAIVGGGPAGCAAALALERLGVERICLIDAGQAGVGRRVGETIPPDARGLLETLGAWQSFAGAGHEPCLGSCAAWGSPALGYNDFVMAGLGPGWHLDRARFERGLLDLARDRGVSIRRACRLRDIDPGSPEPVLHLDGADGETVKARYVIDATGIRAAVARRAGAAPLELDRLSFAYGFFDGRAAASTSKLTVAEAVEDGWWYAASVPGGEVAVAFATDPELAREHRIANEQSWFARLLRTRHVAARLDGCRLRHGSLIVRAAPVRRLDRAAGRCWLAVGDAASAFDPMSSQGIYKALEDGMRAAGAIAESLAADANLSPDYGDAIVTAFEDHRISRNHFYGLEQRWPDAPFWRGRRAARDFAETARAA